MTKPLSFLIAIALSTITVTNAQILNTSIGYSVECIVTDSIVSKHDTLVQVNLILQLNEKLLKEAVKVHVTATKEYGSLRKRTAVYNLENRPVINDLNYIKKVDAVLDHKVDTKELKSKELVYATKSVADIDSVYPVTKEESATDVKTSSKSTYEDINKVKTKTDTIRLEDKVFVFGSLQQVKINFGMYKQWESNFIFEIQIEDKKGKLTSINATSKSVKKDGKLFTTINLSK